MTVLEEACAKAAKAYYTGAEWGTASPDLGTCSNIESYNLSLGQQIERAVR